MAIEKKLIVFKKQENFEKELQQGNILPTSWVVIKDTKKLYVQGTYVGGLSEEEIEEIINSKVEELNLEQYVKKSEYTKITDGSEIIKEIQILDEEGNDEIEVYSKKQCDDRFALKGETIVDLENYCTKEYTTEYVSQEIENLATKEDIEEIKPDWDAQEGENGFIKNKPFGEVNNEIEILNVENVGYATNMGIAYQVISTNLRPIENLVLGDEYIVTIGNNNYKVIAKEIKNNISLTDSPNSTSSNGFIPDGGTFWMPISTTSGSLYTLTDCSNMNVSVKHITKGIKKIDTKYLPDFMKVWQGSEEDYNSLGEYDNNTIYVIQ